MVFDDTCFGLEPVLIKGVGYDFYEGYKKDEGPLLQGIYGILCNANGKFYIGSTQNCQTRFGSHFDALKGGWHVNKIMQSCWNKYGAESFSWYWLEDVSGGKKELYFTEQLYFDFFKPWPENNGMNLARSAYGGTKGKLTYEEKNLRVKALYSFNEPYRIKSPEGEIHEFYSVSAFADKMDLGVNSIRDVLNNRKLSHFGWTLPDTILSEKSFELRSPSGEICKFEDNKSAALEIGVTPPSISTLRRGEINSVNYWTLPTSSPPKRYSVKSPDGNVFTFLSIAQFRKDHGLPVSLGKVLSGKAPHCMGWTLPDVELPPKRLVKVISPLGVEMEVGNVVHFAKANSINSSRLNQMILGKVKSAGGFALKQD